MGKLIGDMISRIDYEDLLQLWKWGKVARMFNTGTNQYIVQDISEQLWEVGGVLHVKYLEN